MESKERRLQERFPLKLQAKLSIPADTPGEMITRQVSAQNISAGGAFLETDLEVNLASKVYLEFLVDFEHLKKLRFILSLDSLKKFSGKKIWVRATGVVIRVDNNGLGIIFDQDYQLSPMHPQDTKT